MSIVSILILLCVVVLGTIGQLALKYSFQGPDLQSRQSPQKLLLSPYLWLWFSCYVIATVLWLVVLRMIPLSQAYPVLGLTFALVPLASYRFLGERIAFGQWFGIGVVVLGVALVMQR